MACAAQRLSTMLSTSIAGYFYVTQLAVVQMRKQKSVIIRVSIVLQ
jgi:hypothetical protein